MCRPLFCAIGIFVCIAGISSNPLKNEVRDKKDVTSEASDSSTICIKVPADENGKMATLCGQKVDKIRDNQENMSSMAVDKQRSAVYPIPGGYGYHTIGQVINPISHYPFGEYYPQFWNHEPIPHLKEAEDSSKKPKEAEESKKMKEGEEPKEMKESDGNMNEDASDLGVNPSARTKKLLGALLGGGLFSSRTSPQIFVIQTPVPAHVPYVATQPAVYYNSDHFFKSAENENSNSRTHSSSNSVQPVSVQQYLPTIESRPTHQSLAVQAVEAQPVHPSVHYSTQYVVEKPVHQVVQQPAHVIPSVSRIPVTLQCEIKPSIMPLDFQKSVGDTLGDSNPYGWQFLHHPEHKILPISYGYRNLDDLLEESNQQRLAGGVGSHSAVIRSSEENAESQDLVTSPGHQMYMEGPNQPVSMSQKSSDIESSYLVPSYPNYRQQMRSAEIQYYYNELMKNAGEIERRAKEIENEKQVILSEINNPLKEKMALLRQSEDRLENLRTQLKNVQLSKSDTAEKTAKDLDGQKIQPAKMEETGSGVFQRSADEAKEMMSPVKEENPTSKLKTVNEKETQKYEEIEAPVDSKLQSDQKTSEKTKTDSKSVNIKTSSKFSTEDIKVNAPKNTAKTSDTVSAIFSQPEPKDNSFP